jgi:hypothetical protein
MAEVSLDGLRVEMSHALDQPEATRRMEQAARDLSKGSLAKLNPTVQAPAPDRIVLSGAKPGGSRFEADIRVAASQVIVEIRGALSLSFIEVTVAGGAAGVRKRVQAEVEKALRERLAA